MYFVINIQKLEGQTAQNVSAYENKKEALSVYHSTLASNYVSDALLGFAVAVLNEHGGTEIKEYYDEPVVVEEVTEE